LITGWQKQITWFLRECSGYEKAAFLPKLSAFYNYSKVAYGNEANLFKAGVPVVSFIYGGVATFCTDI
jgi:hypothetical protein